jgi:peptidoglycan/LPS O-acetylase OafA/YrhL
MKSQRNLGLDLARSIAILLVFSNHLITNVLNINIGPWWYLAYLGVDIFFGLSGFLIGGVLIRVADGSNGFLTPSNTFTFLTRRWLRTSPLYLVLLGLNFFACRFLLKNVYSFDWHFLLWLQNFRHSPSNFFGESWSLCVEEWFYFTFSISLCLFTFLSRNWKLTFRRKLIAFTAVYILIFTVVRIAYCDFNRSEFKIVVFRLDSIAYGVLIAALTQNAIFKRFTHAIGLIGGCLLLSAAILFLLQSRFPFVFIFYYNFAGLGIACCIWYLKSNFSGVNRFLKKIFVLCSKVSYSIYLVNLLVIYLLLSLFHGSTNAIVLTLLALGSVVLVSYFTYRFIELPFLALRERYFPEKKRAIRTRRSKHRFKESFSTWNPFGRLAES